MDTFRRRADALAAELAKTLQCFADTVHLHGDCGSCAIDLAICRDKARALGVEVE